MNELKIIKKQFSFLQEYGFSVRCKMNNIECCVIYSLRKLEIVMTFDLRTHVFEVGMIETGRDDCVRKFVPLLNMEIGQENDKRKLIEGLTAVYSESKYDWTMTKNHFSSLVKLYADFVEKTIKDILHCG